MVVGSSVVVVGMVEAMTTATSSSPAPPWPRSRLSDGTTISTFSVVSCGPSSVVVVISSVVVVVSGSEVVVVVSSGVVVVSAGMVVVSWNGFPKENTGFGERYCSSETL